MHYHFFVVLPGFDLAWYFCTMLDITLSVAIIAKNIKSLPVGGQQLEADICATPSGEVIFAFFRFLQQQKSGQALTPRKKNVGSRNSQK